MPAAFKPPQIIAMDDNCRAEVLTKFPELAVLVSDRLTDDTCIVVDSFTQGPYVEGQGDTKGVLRLNVPAFYLFLNYFRTFLNMCNAGGPIVEAAKVLIKDLTTR